MNKETGLCEILRSVPKAIAMIKGSAQYPKISGIVMFYEVKSGVLVRSEITGLPKGEKVCDDRIFAFHIHSGSDCSGNEQDPFANAKTHYNPDDCPHPYHAGDMPPLFSNDGKAFSVFLTGRFTISEIIDKTVVIHDMPDDFTSQPAGNAGEKIACGIITPTKR